MAKASKWNSSLARAYLHTKDVDNLVTILFLASREKYLDSKAPVNSLNNLFSSLSFLQNMSARLSPKEQPDEVLVPILEELIRHNIGFPSEVDCYQQIYQNLHSQEVRELLTRAANIWDQREAFWTK